MEDDSRGAVDVLRIQAPRPASPRKPVYCVRNAASSEYHVPPFGMFAEFRNGVPPGHTDTLAKPIVETALRAWFRNGLAPVPPAPSIMPILTAVVGVTSHMRPSIPPKSSVHVCCAGGVPPGQEVGGVPYVP